MKRGKGMSRRVCRRGRPAESGFTYIWMLFAVALSGIVLAGAGQLWQTEARREKEAELMFVGEQFRQAIGSYYENSPGAAKSYPDSLEKLLTDDRFPMIKRHLRKIFSDPMTGMAEWGMVRKPGVGIVGVHSLSTQKPFKRANFHERYENFADAVNYQEWKFVYTPGATGGAAQQPKPGSPTQPASQSRPGSQAGSQPGSQSRQPQSERRPSRQPEASPF
ncbi:MAG: type II secretion system protein [Nitrosospira sp.]|nr:type II secretion system protein [Nitrosospira sp.]MDN5882892.1 type II secretion system protein [Nitrosospira sp.]